MKIRRVGAELFHADRESQHSIFGMQRTRLKILQSAPTLYLCVSYGSQNKQRLLPYTALTDWIL